MIRYTTSGQPFEIDEIDLPILEEFSCIHFNYDGYVLVRRPGEKKNYRLHRLIMGSPLGKLVDHHDRNRANNQRDNLRVCTLAQNNRNFPKFNRPNLTSEFKGVSWHVSSKRWRARIYLDNRCICLGLFHCQVKAAEQYDQAAIQHHGPFAKLNFDYPVEKEMVR